MRFKFILPSLLCLLAFSSKADFRRSTLKTDTLAAKDLRPYGRFLLNEHHDLELISSAVHLGVSFKGGECRIYTSIPGNGHNYLQYELDGVYQKRIRVEANSPEPVIIKASVNGKHTLRIYKATEATTGPIIIQKVVANDVRALPNPKQPLIEYIGDSITCGAAADDSEVPCGTGDYHDHHNAYMAYGPRVSRALHTNFIVNSVSGIGIYRTWNMDGPSMPQVYEKIDFQNGNPQQWNFSAYSPKIVSIALGTNDVSNGDGKHPRKQFDTTVFIDNYVKFVQLVKSKYPKAQIALLSSPMVKGPTGIILERCLTAVQHKIDATYPHDKPVATFFFKPMEAHGCAGHPSVADHELMAEQLIPFFKKLL